jgi:hypothetical protein
LFLLVPEDSIANRILSDNDAFEAIETVVPQGYLEIARIFLSMFDILPAGVHDFLQKNKVTPYALIVTIILGFFWIFLLTVNSLVGKNSREKELLGRISLIIYFNFERKCLRPFF